MGLNKSQDLYFVTIDGNVKRTGGTRNLAMGQLAVVDLSKGATKDGAVAINDFTRVSPRSKMELRLGKPKVGVTRSLDTKSYISLPFTLGDIVDLKVDAPKKTGIGNDDFVIGFNGEDGSEISLSNGDNELLQLNVSGTAMGYLGYHDGDATVQFQLEAPNTGTFTMQQIVEEAVERLKNYELIGQVKLTDYVDIIAVNSENPETIPGATNAQFYTLTLQNKGTFSDLGRVQAQYGSLDIKVAETTESETTYVTVATSLPTAYSVSRASRIKGCADCPSGYSAITGGFLYQVTLEDNGTDSTATVQGLPGAVSGSASKNTQIDGVGYYTVVTDNALTDSEIDTFITTNTTATIELISEDLTEICSNSTTTDTAWVAGDTCNTTTETWELTLADDECGSNRLSELQATYEDLTISLKDSDQRRSQVTITGTSGTATVTIGTDTYVATFDTNLTTTAANFVTTHASDILTDNNLTVTSEGEVLSFVGAVSGFTAPTIANTTGNLAGSVATATLPLQFGCQSVYETSIISNIVCEECDPIFRDLFSTEAPDDFDLVAWKKPAKTYSATAKMGIRFRAKDNILSGAEEYRDDLGFVADSVRLRLLGGFPDRINESYELGTSGRMTVKLLDRFEPPINFGGDLRPFEDMSQMYFNGTMRHVGNNYGKFVFGEETRLEGTKQYVDYIFTIDISRTQGGVTQKVFENRTYHVYVEVGRHENVEDLLNDMVEAAGLPRVQAYAKA